MGESYRIRTELGITKTINVELNQEFEFLEILSLKLNQQDVYLRACSDYGVIVGRITANNGLGVPNARVSIFIPIETIDESNPVISSIYPYKSPSDKNEDGYRYNLLPYEKSYSVHAATGTLPTRLDVLTGNTAYEIYDKYYKFTAKTNDSGDYMIMGVPLGEQTVVMDLDLSDIGEFSLTPQDLVRMGRATEAQVAGNRFRTSEDLNSLPQIVNLTKVVEVSPLWGEPSICQIAINRVDFDLRDDANIDIQPTSVFMGSIFSTQDNFRIRKGCRPKDDMGNLCDLSTGPGQILALRQTINLDDEGNPILEQYQLEQSGNIIDGTGAWVTELPMNLEYVATNEFGEKIISYDPAIGVPTKAKYRFKVKWQQPQTITEQTRRAYYLVPNVKEYGWTSLSSDPITITNKNNQFYKKLQSSYYFGLDWSGYTNGFTTIVEKDRRINEIINCEDTFYEFKYNRVYTVSSLIDQYKKGSRGRFIGIKEINNDTCADSINKFPTNEGFKNFDFLFFLFSILMTVIQPGLYFILFQAHILLFFYSLSQRFYCLLCRIKIPTINVRPFSFICNLLNIKCDEKRFIFRLPMLTYPDCEACECKSDYESTETQLPNLPNTLAGGSLAYLSWPETYQNKFLEAFSANTETGDLYAFQYSEAVAGQSLQAFNSNPSVYKIPLSQNYRINDYYSHVSSKNLTLGERVNIFNSRKNYFQGTNKIKVKIEPSINIGPDKYHYDNTITVLANNSFNSGDLISFVNVFNSQDPNFNYSAQTINGLTKGISGTSYTTLSSTNISVTYAETPTNSRTVNYIIPYGGEPDNYKFPSDVEYFQVVTAVTYNDISKIWNPSNVNSFPGVLTAQTIVEEWRKTPLDSVYNKFPHTNNTLRPIDFVDNKEQIYVLVLQRGVDPYSPKYKTEYSLGNLFGTNESDPKFVITAETRFNIPIQTNFNVTSSVDNYSYNELYYQSYFFKPGINGSTNPGEQFSAYTTTNTGYYGLLSNQVTIPPKTQLFGNGVVSSSSNGFYSSTPSGSNYDGAEDLSGLGVMTCNNYFGNSHPDQYINYFGYFYYTKTIYGNLITSALTINNASLNVLRTDRLPSSDQLDGGSWNNNPALLQQNNNFQIYTINSESETISTEPTSTGAQTVTPDIESLPAATNVIESFSCDKMVSLNCYEGFGTNFGINQSCVEKDVVENGCYVFMRRPLIDLFKDWKTLAEWSYRFRFFYGICRGVLSQTFTNNWVNGSLYTFPIQVDVYYNSNNKIDEIKFCKDLIYFNEDSVNFYYRSSPWLQNSSAPNYGSFIGRPPSTNRPVNDRNLLFPTTIINLGMKDYFLTEISFDPDTRAYVVPSLDSTSYGDTSDLVNLFVISRITDNIFLRSITNFGDNAINELFSRGNVSILNQARRIDGDLAQLFSINSELGVIKFSQEYYENVPGSTNNAMTILGTPYKPVMAVWYSSTTENLQTKDYLTPGRIDFRNDTTGSWFPYNYGIKSQNVPFYQWELNSNSTGNPPKQLIFGSQLNNWKTNYSTNPNNLGIFSKPYQSLDRTNLVNPTYFQSVSSPNQNDLNRRGYIFSLDSNGKYSPYGVQSKVFQVGAPFHFYFGVIKGESALDKFKTKYLPNE